MKWFDVINIIIFSMPLGIFTTFGLFLAVTVQMRVKRIDMLLRRLIALYCFFSAVSGLMFLFFYYLPGLFYKLEIVYFISSIYGMILFYHFLYFAIKKPDSFRHYHYVVPLFFAAGIWMGKFFFPVFWEQEGYYILFGVMSLFGILYSIFPVYTMYRYHLALTLKSRNTEIIHKNRVIPYLAEVILFPVVIIILPMITGHDPPLALSILMILSLFLAMRMDIPLTYAMIRHYTSPLNDAPLFAPSVTEMNVHAWADHKTFKEKGTTISPEPKRENSKRNYRKNIHKKISGSQSLEIDKKVFENYIQKNKPYLNPDLTIMDLVIPLQSNRTYISKFINHTYQMNFSSYINGCRFREMERLLQRSANKGKKPKELLRQAGFGNYRHYMRVKAQFDPKNKM